MSRSDCVREPYLTPHFAIRGDAQFVSLSDYWLSQYTCKVFRPNTALPTKVQIRGKNRENLKVGSSSSHYRIFPGAKRYKPKIQDLPTHIHKGNQCHVLWLLDPKPISNDQVGSGPCPHSKFLEASRGKISIGQKCQGKVTFSM